MIDLKERVRQARQRNREQFWANERDAEERDRLVTTNSYLFRELYFVEDAAQLVRELGEPQLIDQRLQINNT